MDLISIRKNGLLVSLFLFTTFISGCNTWFDVTNDLWKQEAEYVSRTSLPFDASEDSLNFSISNTGSDNVSFSIENEPEWLNVDPLSGTVSRGESTTIRTSLNRFLLEEGNNTGVVIVRIDDGKEPKKRHPIDVSAFGLAGLEINPDILDFGASSSTKTLSLCSKTGQQRCFTFTPLENWIKMDERVFFLDENISGSTDLNKNITVSCDRSLLNEGTHEGIIHITSAKETYVNEYKVIVTIPKQGIQSQQIEDFIFSISSSPYRDPDGTVIVNVDIENASSYYRTFALNSSSSRAITIDNDSFRCAASSVNINKKSSKTLQIKVVDVPESITAFSSIELDFSLSELVIFPRFK